MRVGYAAKRLGSWAIIDGWSRNCPMLGKIPKSDSVLNQIMSILYPTVNHTRRGQDHDHNYINIHDHACVIQFWEDCVLLNEYFIIMFEYIK